MKRYLFSILLAVFAVGGIGACYIYSAAEPLPRYKLTAIEGNSEEAESIELSGSHYGRIYSEFLNVTTEESRYTREQFNFRNNILNSRSWFLGQSDVQTLVSEHRQFMRGKDNINGLYSDEEWLIYAAKTDYGLNIELLQKTTQQTRLYELALDENNLLNLVDVQLTDDRIHILMTQYVSELQPNSIYDYIVDLNNGQLLSGDKINFDTVDGRGGSGSGSSSGKNSTNDGGTYLNRFRSITDRAYTSPSSFVVFVKAEEKVNSTIGRNAYSVETVAKQYYAYSYKTGELSALPIEGGEMDVHILANDLFLYASSDSERIVISSYDLEAGGTSANTVTVTAGELGATEISNSMMLDNDRLYVLLDKATAPKAAVVDSRNGEILYKGEVVYDGSAAKAKANMERLHITNIGIRR